MINIFKQRLMKIHNKIKNHKDINKVWVVTDFKSNVKLNCVYLDILNELGFLEEVEAWYQIGKIGRRSRTRGWRLIQNGSD